MLDGEGRGGRTRDEADGQAGHKPVAPRLERPKRPGQGRGGGGSAPHLGQGDERCRGTEGHLEPRRDNHLWLQGQHSQGGYGEGMQTDRPAVGEDGEEGDAGGYRGPPRRGMGAGEDQIQADHDQGAQGRQLLGGKPQREPRDGGDEKAEGKKGEAA